MPDVQGNRHVGLNQREDRDFVWKPVIADAVYFVRHTLSVSRKKVYFMVNMLY